MNRTYIKKIYLVASVLRISRFACLTDVPTCELCRWHPILLQRYHTLRPSQDGRHFPDNIFKSIFVNENVWISTKFSPQFVPRCPINIIPVLVQIMAWRRPGDKLLSEPMMVSLPTHICVTRPQWVNTSHKGWLSTHLSLHWFIYWLVSAWSQAIIWTSADCSLIEQIHWKFSQNKNISVQENAFEVVVCNMTANLSLPHCVDT